MRILVLGASGGVGRHAVNDALARGWTVRAVVRATTAYAPPVDPSLEVLRGDVLDDDLLAAAVDGVGAVVSSLGGKRVRPGNPWSRLESRPDFAEASAVALVRAMRAAGVARVVAVSAAGVGDSYAALNLPMRLFLATSTIGVQYADLERMEAVYATSGLAWHAVRPVALFDGPRTGGAHAVESFGMRSWIARADVAAWLLDRVADDRFVPNTPMIAGPVVGAARNG